MGTETEERNRALVLEAFDALFNRRDFAAAARFWSPDYIQHSALLPPGRDGVFGFVEAAPPTMRYEPHVVAASGDHVIIHCRFSGTGGPATVSANVLRIADGRFAEHWEVLQPEATRAESRSGRPMFADRFPD